MSGGAAGMGDEPPLFSLFHIGSFCHTLNKAYERDLGLSLVQWYCLKRLADMPGASPLSLAEAVGVHPSTLTQTTKRLARKGFLFISGHPKDSRKRQIAITRSGHSAMLTATARIQEWSEGLTPVAGDIRRVRLCLESQVAKRGRSGRGEGAP